MKYDPYKYVMPIQTIDKQTYAMQAVLNTLNSDISNEAKLSWIEVITREFMKELAPEIRAIKEQAMKADPDKYRPGDIVGGY